MKLIALVGKSQIVERLTFSHNITVLRQGLQAATATVNVTSTGTATSTVTATATVNVTVTATVNVSVTTTAKLMLLPMLMLLPLSLSVSQSPYSLVYIKRYVGCIWKQFVASQHFQDQLLNAVIVVY